ncbi:hypothetical protein F7734_16140 [Scytonema sp. UIC 10036]|uniref:hypothetical protein n=1 Tax=Scytonema sp. UIC 10036 TaxID=2304196 RepID=UPI0012DA20ED|nr:hypothetical protein [Scytonema sp. UIC 10036]MUG93861.1 hypothetical protein [Scytonema sp. UIC 10036]
MSQQSTQPLQAGLTPILQGISEIVGWVEHERYPTNADKCWVSFLNPTYVQFEFLAKPT